LLNGTWGRKYNFEPVTQFKEQPCEGLYVNIEKGGFRKTVYQGPWPPDEQYYNIFVFGGSTAFSYGVPDNETIALYLQANITNLVKNEII